MAMAFVSGPARGRLGAALIAVACLAAFGPALAGGFVWDDDTHLLDNPVFEPGGLRAIWASPPQVINYWPLSWTSYWLEHQLWGFDPLGYHVVNLALHVASCLLVWAVLRRLALPAPWLAALVFAVHPVNVESVAWITQRKNLLSLLFFAASLLAYLRFDERRRPGPYVAALAAHGLAMLSKGAAAPLPAVLLLIAWWRRGRVARRDLVAAAPFFAVTGLASVIEIAGQQLVAGELVVRDHDLVTRGVGAGWAFWFYLSKAWLPLGLSFVYPRWEIDPGDPVAWLPLVAIVALLALAWRGRHGRGRPLLFALLYYGLMLSPVLGFFDIFYMRYSYVADHYQYLALIAPVALAVGAASVALASAPRRVRIAAAAAVVVACVLASARLSADYRDAETLWRATLARNPDAFLAHYNLAHQLHGEGRLDAAAHHYRETLRIRPGDPQAHTNLGRIAQDQGRPDEAMAHYRQALESAPATIEARSNLAGLLRRAGDLDGARAEYRRALADAPDSAALHYNLGLLLEQMGRRDDAIASFRNALRADPTSRDVRAALRRVSSAGGR